MYIQVSTQKYKHTTIIYTCILCVLNKDMYNLSKNIMYTVVLLCDV